MPSNLPQFTVRVDRELLDKLHYVAEYNARSANGEVALLIRRHITNFEKKHGKIPINKSTRTR